jgi:6-phosphogluconate dehydrogenase
MDSGKMIYHLKIFRNMKKQLGYIGLGKMGFNMAARLLGKGYDITAYDRNAEAVRRIAEKGAKGAESIGALASALPAPRLVWIMVPHEAVNSVLAELLPHLQNGDTVIDGGNSPYVESVRRGRELSEKGIHFLDVGISGGPGGARDGACVMVGGEKEQYENFKELFADISAPDAYGYMGTSGAGHFTKMTHNGIEYGMMQAIAEGFEVLKRAEFGISLKEAARVYNNRSVIESRLVGWLSSAYKEYGENLDEISGEVAATGEGLWTVEAAKRLGVPTPIIEGSVEFRNQSTGNPSYTGKVLSALRNQFGGHEAKSK